MKTVRKIFGILCFLAFVSGLCWSNYIDTSYSKNLPHYLDEKSGNIYKIAVNHGYIVYATQEELDVLNSSIRWWHLSITCGAIAGLISFIYNDFPAPKDVFFSGKKKELRSPLSSFTKRTIIVALIMIALLSLAAFLLK